MESGGIEKVVPPKKVRRRRKDILEEDGSIGKCRICDAQGSGVFFGVLTCIPCKAFYIRTTAEDTTDLRCTSGDDNCVITMETRSSCKACRFRKCLLKGMVRRTRPVSQRAAEGYAMCAVCQEPANGVHFGAVTCEGCKKFFRRGLREQVIYQCFKNNSCEVAGKSRKACRGCRWRKCLQAGMSEHAVQMGRPSRTHSNSPETSPKRTSPSTSRSALFNGKQRPRDNGSTRGRCDLVQAMEVGESETVRMVMSSTTEKRHGSEQWRCNPPNEVIQIGSESQSPNASNDGTSGFPPREKEGCSDILSAKGPNEKSLEKVILESVFESLQEPNVKEIFLRKLLDAQGANSALCGNNSTSGQQVNPPSCPVIPTGCCGNVVVESAIHAKDEDQKNGLTEVNRVDPPTMKATSLVFGENNNVQGNHNNKESKVMDTPRLPDAMDLPHSPQPPSNEILKAVANQTLDEGVNGMSCSISRRTCASPTSSMIELENIFNQAGNDSMYEEGKVEGQWRDHALPPFNVDDTAEAWPTEPMTPFLCGAKLDSRPSVSAALYNFSKLKAFFSLSKTNGGFAKPQVGNEMNCCGFPECIPGENTTVQFESDFDNESKEGLVVDGVEEYWDRAAEETDPMNLTPNTGMLIGVHVMAYEYLAKYHLDVCENATEMKKNGFENSTILQYMVHQFTKCMGDFVRNIPGHESIDSRDFGSLMLHNSYQCVMFVAANTLYDAEKNIYHKFYVDVPPICRPDHLLYMANLNLGQLCHPLQLDHVELAFMCALILISADLPGLQDVAAVERLRRRHINILSVYVTGKYGSGSGRLKSLFSLIPKVRIIGQVIDALVPALKFPNEDDHH